MELYEKFPKHEATGPGCHETRLAEVSSPGGLMLVCPPASNGSSLPIWVYRGAGVTKLGPWLRAWLSGVCVGLGCRN